MAIILIVSGNFGALISYFGLAVSIFYALCGISIFKLRSKNPEKLVFKTKPFPFVPLVFIFSVVIIIISDLLINPIPSIMASMFLLVSIPIYFLFFWRGNLILQFINNIQK